MVDESQISGTVDVVFSLTRLRTYQELERACTPSPLTYRSHTHTHTCSVQIQIKFAAKTILFLFGLICSL